MADDRRAEDRARTQRLHIGIAAERPGAGRIVKQDGLLGIGHGVHHRHGQGVVLRLADLRRHADASLAICRGAGFQGEDALTQKKQESAAGAGVFHHDLQQAAEQPVEHELTGDRLRRLDQGQRIEAFRQRGGGPCDRTRRILAAACGPAKLGMGPLQRCHPALGAPEQVGAAGGAQVRGGHGGKPLAAAQVRGQLAGQRLVLQKAVLAGGDDRPLI